MSRIDQSMSGPDDSAGVPRDRWGPPDIISRHEAKLRPVPAAPIGVLRVAHEVWQLGSRNSRFAAPHHTLMLVRAGRLRVESSGGTFERGKGHLIILPVGRRRTHEVLARLDCLLFDATGPLLAAHLRALAPDGLGAVRLTRGEAAWLWELWQGAQQGAPHAGEAVGEALVGLLAVLRLRSDEPRGGGAGARLVRRAMELLAGGWRGHVGAHGLARDLGVHPDHLARCFRRHAGCGLAEHLLRLRMQQAMRALAAGQSCAAVAAQVGYADAFAFSKAFRRHTGVAPSRWPPAGPAEAPPAADGRSDGPGRAPSGSSRPAAVPRAPLPGSIRRR